jgi:putative SOS response-associated peptidase YedK
MGISEGLSRMSWKLSRTVLRGGVIGNGGSLLGKGKTGSKQPYFLHLPSGEPFAFAGLWEAWETKGAPPEPDPYKSCTIITTDASEAVKGIHNRMPLILKPEAYEEWLDPSNKEPAKIEELLKTKFVEDLTRYPVSKLVNQVGNNKKECMEPLEGRGD